MRNNRYQPFFIACRIWILAVLFNTLLGTLFLGYGLGLGMIPMLLFYGMLFGMIVSSPAIVLLFVLINRCIVKRLKGIVLFRLVLTSAIVLAVIAWLLYMQFFKSFEEENIYFLLFGIISGLAATSTQQQSIIRVTDYSEPFEVLSHEN
ncbi:hypothetical protein [Paraflavitalea speifideaquila]|uniref:hypothetical protein n=1 Tax=Paraflavitalea speifideaquila TaxID=3076558 RepID=UPI0028E687E3|nr:hypothetical protein [Paraflavitalea speifideiaquila]